MSLSSVVAQINQGLAKQSSMRIGKVLKHPDGRGATQKLRPMLVYYRADAEGIEHIIEARKD